MQYCIGRKYIMNRRMGFIQRDSMEILYIEVVDVLVIHSHVSENAHFVNHRILILQIGIGTLVFEPLIDFEKS